MSSIIASSLSISLVLGLAGLLNGQPQTEVNISIRFENKTILSLTANHKDPIKSIMMQIENTRGIRLKDQALFRAGQELGNINESIEDYNIRNNDVLDLVVRLRIFIKSLDGYPFVCIVEPTTTIGKVKRQLGYSMNQKQLVLRGEILEDERTLEEYRIGYGETLYLLVRAD